MSSLPNLLDETHSQIKDMGRISILAEKCPVCNEGVSYELFGRGNPVCNNPACEMYCLPVNLSG
ncbi:hypothetical protein FJZ19_02040 [Candidatus Pacearchaeota archaeon]|nr:hypothetical protein [Candidatus Pacearchaeota archaeon]